MMRKVLLSAAGLLAVGIVAMAGDKLEIVKAEYGAGEKWADVTDKVQQKVVNDELKLEVSNQLFGDPARGLAKTLKVTAKSGDKQALFQAAERKQLIINAEEFKKAAAVPVADVAAAAKITIVKAEYGAGETQADVTAKVQEMVARGIVKIDASNALFGDPVKGKGKTLKIQYRIGDQEKTKDAAEKSAVTLD